MSNAVPVIYDPVSVSLTDPEKLKAVFDVSRDTLMKWHYQRGFPIAWDGEGKGRRGYVPVREAREWFKRRAMNKPG